MYLIIFYNKGANSMNIIDELSWRGAVNQMTDEEGLRKLTDRTLEKLSALSDEEFDALELYPEI